MGLSIWERNSALGRHSFPQYNIEMIGDKTVWRRLRHFWRRLHDGTLRRKSYTDFSTWWKAGEKRSFRCHSELTGSVENLVESHEWATVWSNEQFNLRADSPNNYKSWLYWSFWKGLPAGELRPDFHWSRLGRWETRSQSLGYFSSSWEGID